LPLSQGNCQIQSAKIVIEKSRMIAREEISDPWDRLIAATSMHLGFPLITRDRSLRKIGLETVW